MESFKVTQGGTSCKKLWDKHRKPAISKFRKYCVGQSNQNIVYSVAYFSFPGSVIVIFPFYKGGQLLSGINHLGGIT